MSRFARVSFGLAAALAAFALLDGCGQRGPLTLPESARPIQRLDKNAPPAQTPAPATETPESVAPGAAPSGATPEDDERAKK